MARISAVCLILTLTLFTYCLPARAQDNWSLQRCVDYAKAHNIQVKQSELQERLAKLTLEQSRLSRLPTLSSSIDYGYNFGRSIDPTTNGFVNNTLAFSGVSANLGLSLFNWFQTRNTIASNTYAAAAGKAMVEKLKNDISLNVATAYLQILLNKEQLKTNIEQVKLSRSQLDNTEKQVIAGALPQSNQADLEAQVASDSASLIVARNNVVMAILQMKALLNLDFSTAFDVSLPGNIDAVPLMDLQQHTPESIYNEALQSQPLVLADSLHVKAAEKSFAAAKGGYYPSLSLFAGMGTNYSSTYVRPAGETIIPIPPAGIGTVDINNTTYPVMSLPRELKQSNYEKPPLMTQLSDLFRQNIGISLNIPILNGWQVRSNVARANINLLNQQFTREQDQLTLKQTIYQAYADARAAREQYLAMQKAQEASQTALDYASKRYELGLINSVDYLTTQNNLFKAETNTLTAKYNYIFKMKLLEFYRGQNIQL